MRKNTQLDRKIRETMTKEFPVPEKVKNAQDAAFSRIRDMQVQKEVPGKQKSSRSKCFRGIFFKTFAGLAAAVAVFLIICIADPAFAAQIPLVGRVFETVGDSLGFSGDYRGYVEPLDETEHALPQENTLYSQTENGMTITLSEVYCNDTALYISMVIQSDEEFPETMCDQNNGDPILSLQDSTIRFDYNPKECLLAYGGSDNLDGKFVDAHTYAGVIRCDLSAFEDASDYEKYDKERNKFIQSLGGTEQEMDEDISAAYEKVCKILGVENMESFDEAIAEAGGPDLKEYKKKVQVPETFRVRLSVPMVVGYKAHADTPEMPKDIRAAYKQAMQDHGLGLTDDDYTGFTDEQKEIEHQLSNEMWNKYVERYPETNEHPNRYENWWVEGPWEFSLNVNKNNSDTIVKNINDVDSNGLGLVSVTKTPFEITIDDGLPNGDHFTVALDADGDILDYGSGGSSTNTFAIQDRDVSKIDVYICDYIEYMDELKVYYWSEDYEVKKKEKTFKQLLDERALYHKEVVFGR